MPNTIDNRFNQVKKVDILASMPYQYCDAAPPSADCGTDANENSLAVGAGLRFQLKPPTSGEAPKTDRFLRFFQSDMHPQQER